MLDPRGNDTGSMLNIKDPWQPGYIQTVQKKNTVRELLMMMRRQGSHSEQKLKRSHDDDIEEHHLKSAKIEVLDTDPQLFGAPVPVDPNTAAQFNPVAPDLLPQFLYPEQYPALRGPEAPADEGTMSLFHWQIQQAMKKVEALSPEQLNTQDADGDTFLHIAVAQGRRALAYVLAAKMAGCGSLDVKEHNGQTALQIAVATNQHLIVQDLLTHGAQINTRDFWGRSPLHVCAEKGFLLSLQSIFKTLTGQVDIEMYNYDGLTPLHAAVLSHNAVVKEMVRLENPCSDMMRKLLHRSQIYVECIKTLLHMGASFGTKDLKSGRTCLHMASEEANVELLNIFLDQPTSLSVVNVKTFSGNTALHIVSALQNHKSQVEAVKLLMRRGADPGSRNIENEMPSQLAPGGHVGEKVRLVLKGKHIHV